MKKKFSIVLSAVMAASLVLLCFFAMTACGEPEGAKLEAEKAVMQGTPAGGVDFVKSSADDSEVQASGWLYAGSLAAAGNTVTWTFTSDGDGAADLEFVLANTAASALELNKCVEIAVNDKKVGVSGSLRAAGKNNEDWESVVLKTDALKKGFNFIKMTVLANTLGDNGTVAAPNVDYVRVIKDGVATHKHAWSDEQHGGCTTAGYVHSACTECGLTYDHSYADALGHDIGADGVCTVCGKTVYVYEAEYADLSGFESSYGAVIDISSSASNGHSVGSFSVVGNTIKFNVVSTRDDTVDLIFRMASTKWAAGSVGGNAHIADTVLAEAVTIELNGADITPTAVLKGSDSEYYFNWSNVVVAAQMKAGDNALRIIAKTDAGAPNVDCIQMTAASAELSWTDIDNINGQAGDNENGEVTAAKPANAFAKELVCEAEDAVHDGRVNADGTNMSGGKYVGDVYGGKSIKFAFTAAAAGKGALVLKMASTGASWNNGVAENMLDYDLAANTELLVNGTAVDLAGLKLSGSAAVDFYNWNYLTVKVSLATENTVELKVPCDWGGPNIDCLYVYSDADCTVSAAPDEPSAESSAVTATKPDHSYAHELTYEAENAATDGAVKDDCGDASGGGYVGDVYAGKSIKFTFTAAAAGKGTIVLKMASTGANWVDNAAQNMLDYYLDDNTELYVNGARIGLDGLKLAGYPGANFYNWNYLAVTGLDLTAENTVELKVPCAWGGPNVDCLYVCSDVVCAVKA